MTALIEIEGVETGYGRVKVLHGLSVELQEGANIGLFGPNGHGKTTLLRAVSGLLRCWSGSIRFLGQEIANLSPRRIVEMGLIHVPQGSRLFPELTVGETLTLGAQRKEARPEQAKNQEQVLAIFPKLRERWRQRVSTLSGGERQMLSIGMAMMNHPRLLLLDEPTLGLAPKIKEELAVAIHKISAEGVPLIVVEQDVEFLLDLTSRLFLVSHGVVERSIDSEHPLGHEDIMQMYFGH